MWKSAAAAVFIFISVDASAGYVFTALPGFINATAINNRGDVVGIGNSQTGSSGLIYSDGRVSTVTPFTDSGFATDINDRGEIVGFTNSLGSALLGDTLTRLGSLGGYSYASAINNHSDIVGTSYLGVQTPARGVLYSRGNIIELGTLGGLWSSATDINDRGQIVGYASLSEGATPFMDVEVRAALFQDGQVVNLGTLGGLSYAYGINNSGDIIGYSQVGNTAYATRFTSEGPVNMGSLGAGSYAYGINNRGTVVGASYTGEPGITGLHAALYIDDQVIDLNDFLSAESSNLTLLYAFDINDRGQIVGEAYDSITNTRLGYILTPVSEPATFPLLIAGILVLVFGGSVKTFTAVSLKSDPASLVRSYSRKWCAT